MSPSSFLPWYHQAKQNAIRHQVGPEELDWLVLGYLDLDKLSLRLGQITCTSEQLKTLQILWQKRLTERIPVQYLLGKTPWRSFWLEVTPAVLIPRPETELLVDLALDFLYSLSSSHILDLGTGSGAIALAIAHEAVSVHCTAIDRSPEALAVARKNAHALGYEINFLEGDWFSPLGTPEAHFDAILSNPPYIPSATVESLDIEVRQYEPQLALDGGTDGLSAIRILIEQGWPWLKPEGLWLVELMVNQAPMVMDLLAANGHYQEIQSHRDLTGIERFVSAKRISIDEGT
ncbi:MAG: peptide chain release factor N(5)-glutamine methyltransferase [Gloeobacterales cyanobacterium]